MRTKLRNLYYSIRETWWNTVVWRTPVLYKIDNWWWPRSPAQIPMLVRQCEEHSYEVHVLERRVEQLEARLAAVETVSDLGRRLARELMTSYPDVTPEGWRWVCDRLLEKSRNGELARELAEDAEKADADLADGAR